MLIEHRAYTLRLGTTESFWDAQRERGADGLRPIVERLIGAFAARSGATDQIVSLYRYDSFEDWQVRLLGLYGQADLQSYFRAVRTLIVCQETKFLVPAPLPDLAVHWGNGRDWLPKVGPVFAAPRALSVVEELTLSLVAGGVPECWKAFREHGLHDDSIVASGLFGVFSTIAGTLNQVLLYRCFPDFEAWSAYRKRLGESSCWKGILHSLAPLTVDATTKLLEPSRVADMSPLFEAP
ncbi:NIPSNAP family protein [Caballeronia ptereochthonis]|uniref:NIPSNAP domain-containing protein n=1 Tax=Caballeronia ptereochthonis TaxID=1777144 RepID=A0A158C2U4_9BURK|nr:NIPSNAP family protein [Caballeronia ptereochthonis]SAK76642.1 hypothetical protein AWB83_03938 [Caballeronia ptereochthonis]